MKKTLLTILLTSCVLTVFSQTHSPDVRKVKPLSANVQHVAIPLSRPVTGEFNNSSQNPTVNQRNGTTPVVPLSTIIGSTTHDLQSNGSMGNKIYFSNDTIGAIWNHSSSLTNPNTYRETGYNYYDGTIWTGGTQPLIDSIGYSTIDVGSNNMEYVVGHLKNIIPGTNALMLYKRNAAIGGPWQKSNLPPHPQGVSCMWAKMAVGGANGQTIHVIALTLPTGSAGTPVNGIDGAMTYSRSPDGGASWDIVHAVLPGIDSLIYYSMEPESYAIDVNGNSVAIVQGTFYNDWAMWKSTDNGTTWTKSIIMEFPLAHYNPNTDLTDVDGDGVADTLEFIDPGLEVLIDNNNLVHCWAGRMRVLDTDPFAAFGYFPDSDGLYYWNESFQGVMPEILTSAVDLDNDGVISIHPFIAPYEKSLSGMPSAGVDAANNIYLVYSSIKENTSSGSVPDMSYRNTYAMVSPDGGNSWTPPVNVFDSDFDEVVYPAIAGNVNSDMHIIVQIDGYPGHSFNGPQPVIPNDIYYLNKDVNSYFAGLPLIPVLNYGLEGKVYFDQNQNGSFDSSDFGLSYYPVSVAPIGLLSLTNSSGMYSYNIPPNTYTVNANINTNWILTSDSASYTVSLSSNLIDSLDFGLYPSLATYEFNTELVGGVPRCNNTIDYWINIHNEGTSSLFGKVRFIMDSQLSYNSSAPLYNSSIGDTFIWNYSGLLPFEQRAFRITVNSTGLFPGDTIVNSSQVSYDNFGLPNTIYDSLSQAITCSYDPNDKLVSPEGFDVPHYTLKTDTLLYTIRFQNTGNDTAFVVKIRDTLSTHLDYSTFGFIGSSHPVNVTRQANGAMIFTFNNILLPDSNTNNAASIGFISYSIKPKANVVPGTVIYNTAHIFFDYNPAIVTNTTFNTMIDLLGVTDEENEKPYSIAMPNPFSSDVTIKFLNPVSESHTIRICDVAGRTISRIDNFKGYQTEMNLSHITSGIYFCEVIAENGNVMGRVKIVKN
ncbi:MAG: T9SS type A sorting domain-containing protein [Bacteroidia bacterium]|nr:T9SS type A sorting domain-containing protein [Bacteroidia bacterium]